MASPIEHVIFDFDGTCTQIPLIYKAYLEAYRRNLSKVVPVSEEDWQAAQTEIHSHSPDVGWTLASCPAAPCAADPYILADESARHLLKTRTISTLVPPDVNGNAYSMNSAPWRPEARQVFERLTSMGLRVHLISNTGSEYIAGRLNELFGASHPILSSISVQSGAAKFRITEVAWDFMSAPENLASFRAISATYEGKAQTLARPIYLRRGSYFEAICMALGPGPIDFSRTLFCGDIWEMDLAMPHALGANVHLIDRASPFATYDYERVAIRTYSARARSSQDLTGLFSWFE